VPLDDGQTLISGSYDKEIIIWNVLTGAIVQKLTTHQSSVTCLTLLKNRVRLISGGLDNQINVWRINYKKSPAATSGNSIQDDANEEFIDVFESCFL
jgi:WD40 repeat protein